MFFLKKWNSVWPWEGVKRQGDKHFAEMQKEVQWVDWLDKIRCLKDKGVGVYIMSTEKYSYRTEHFLRYLEND